MIMWNSDGYGTWNRMEYIVDLLDNSRLSDFTAQKFGEARSRTIDNFERFVLRLARCFNDSYRCDYAFEVYF